MTRDIDKQQPGPADDGRAKRDAELRLTAETIGTTFERMSARAEYLGHLKELGDLLKGELGLARAPVPKHLDLTIDTLYSAVSLILDDALLRADSQQTQLVSSSISIDHPLDRDKKAVPGLRCWEVDWLRLVSGYVEAINPALGNATDRKKEFFRSISDGTLEIFRKSGARNYRSIDEVIRVEKERAQAIGQIDNAEEHERAREVFHRLLHERLGNFRVAGDRVTQSERSLSIPYDELFDSELGRLKSKITTSLVRSQGEQLQDGASALTTTQIAEQARQMMLDSVSSDRATSLQIAVAYLEFRKEVDQCARQDRVKFAGAAAKRIIDRNEVEPSFPPAIPAAREHRLDNLTLGRYLVDALKLHKDTLETI